MRADRWQDAYDFMRDYFAANPMRRTGTLRLVDLLPSTEPFESAPRCMETTLRAFNRTRKR